jgi:hypothetical protein
MQVGHTYETDEMDPVVRWRLDLLAGDGFGRLLALRLAYDLRWDLHALLELHARGCPPELATRILAPDDVEDAELP